MTKSEVIESIAGDKLVEELSSAMGVPQMYYDDLVQEIYLILLEYDEAKIVQMYEKNQLKFFLVRIIQNQMFSKYSPFYKKYRKFSMMTEELSEGYDDNSDMEEDQ